MMTATITLVVGFVLGVLASFALRLVQAKTAKELSEELALKSDTLRQNEIDAVIENVKQSFGGLSLEALSKNTEQFLALAGEKLSAERDAGGRELDAKRGLIDQRLSAISESMTGELGKLAALVLTMDKERRESFGAVSQRLVSTGEQIVKLTTVTGALREAMASTKQRGQWGERMAADVLMAAGFIEGVNYLKQASMVDGARPDFTFLLPQDRVLNMDVKFPFNAYLQMLEAQERGIETDVVRFKKQFLGDVRLRMKEITSRVYIDQDQGTCDYAVMFIPNEAIYSFIHAEDPDLLDAGLKQRVIFCSPITLFAVLAVIRQAVDQFAMSRNVDEVLAQIGTFNKQWGMFTEQLEKVGRRIADSSKEFDELNGTRRRQLERPLGKIEDLRTQRGLPVAEEAAS
jgi:DNA recombination protein RmuC